MKSFVVLRLSSMGDVLLTVPVIRGILASNPDIHLIFVTRQRFCGYFTGIARLSVIGFDPDKLHKGLIGIFRLYREICKHEFVSVIDLHGILRTWILDGLFLLRGYRIFSIRKYRKERRAIISHNKPGLTVPHTADRYQHVFLKAGLAGEISETPLGDSEDSANLDTNKTGLKRIGIAPLSKHSTKNWGISQVATLTELLRASYDCEIHLFGGREDQELLDTLSAKDIFNHAGRISPTEEISLIRTLQVFVSMDSANMHLAALAGIPTVSVWGGTDPKLGFAPLYQPDDFAIYMDPSIITCRPCSVYGETPCKRADSPMICMTSIKPEQVFNKITEILSSTDKE